MGKGRPKSRQFCSLRKINFVLSLACSREALSVELTVHSIVVPVHVSMVPDLL